MAASVDRQADKTLAIPRDDVECFAWITEEIRFCMESFGNAISVLKTSDALEHVAVVAIQVPPPVLFPLTHPPKQGRNRRFPL